MPGRSHAAPRHAPDRRAPVQPERRCADRPRRDADRRKNDRAEPPHFGFQFAERLIHVDLCRRLYRRSPAKTSVAKNAFLPRPFRTSSTAFFALAKLMFACSDIVQFQIPNSILQIDAKPDCRPNNLESVIWNLSFIESYTRAPVPLPWRCGRRRSPQTPPCGQ